MPRNRVRNELLPLLQRRYQPALAKTVLRLMEIVGAEAEVVGEIARQWLETHVEHDPAPGLMNFVAADVSRALCVPAKSAPSPRGDGEGLDFDDLPVAVQRRVVQLQLSKLGVLADFELVEQLRNPARVQISVGPGLFVLRDTAGRVNLRREPASGIQRP